MFLPQINWCLGLWFRPTFSFLFFWCWQFISTCLSACIFLCFSCIYYWCPWNYICWTWNCSFCLQTWATWKVNFLRICKVAILFKPIIKTCKWWGIHRIQINLIQPLNFAPYSNTFSDIYFFMWLYFSYFARFVLF